LVQVDAVIFDMDGVLIDARDWHYQALNEALSYFGCEIEYQEHLSRFDGLPTARKLAILSETNRLPKHVHGIVESVKQERTLRIAAERCYPQMQHLVAIGWIRNSGIKVGVATNSIRPTSTTMLTYAGIMPLVDCLVTNQDVSNAKPSPEIYLETCRRLGVSPANTLVFEDNENGLEAARLAGCRVVRVLDPQEVDLGRIQFEINRFRESS
jgi:HAD superfamily hydrolase (TIGR01509 family)